AEIQVEDSMAGDAKVAIRVHGGLDTAQRNQSLENKIREYRPGCLFSNLRQGRHRSAVLEDRDALLSQAQQERVVLLEDQVVQDVLQSVEDAQRQGRERPMDRIPQCLVILGLRLPVAR